MSSRRNLLHLMVAHSMHLQETVTGVSMSESQVSLNIISTSEYLIVISQDHWVIDASWSLHSFIRELLQLNHLKHFVRVRESQLSELVITANVDLAERVNCHRVLLPRIHVYKSLWIGVLALNFLGSVKVLRRTGSQSTVTALTPNE